MFPNLQHPDNPVVFFDVSIGGREAGRLQMELYADLLPRTCENFRQLCTGDYLKDGRPIGYKHSSIYKVIKDYLLMGGDLGPTSIYGGCFEDEGFQVLHASEGIVTMVNDGANMNGSRFAITCAAADWMDGINVAFGRIYPFSPDSKSLTVLRTIEHTPTGPDGLPVQRIRIDECGQM